MGLPAAYRLLLFLPAYIFTTLAQSTSSGPVISSTLSPAPVSPTGSAPQASVTVNPGNNLFTYQGCFNETTGFTENGGTRALRDSGIIVSGKDDMTVEQCIAYCGTEQYAGLEYGRECWCGQHLSSLSTKLPDNECNYPCTGASSSACGGQLKLSLYLKTGTVPAKKGGASENLVVSSLGLTASLGTALLGALILA